MSMRYLGLQESQSGMFTLTVVV